MLSLVVPLYSSEENLPRLLEALVQLQIAVLPEPFEVVLVDDGSPDRCQAILEAQLPELPLSTTLVSLSRNFGSFAAIAAGLKRARGDYFAVLAADLQEPPQIIVEFLETLRRGEADVVFGVRVARSDPWLTEFTSNLFWATYRRFVMRDMPRGGVDVFACTRMVRDQLLALPEASTNLIALLFWLGFRRKFVSYERQARLEGRSAWTLKRRLKYALDSVFNFTDLPVQVLLAAGGIGSALAVILGAIVLWARVRGGIPVPGYTPTVLTVMFFGGISTLGLGIVGQYLWLALQNVRRRPNYVVRSAVEFPPAAEGGEAGAPSPTTGSRGTPGSQAGGDE
jgi:glycosyltransferase involved in cell wall biosynthesis